MAKPHFPPIFLRSYNHLAQHILFVFFPSRNMTSFLIEIFFYESFIFHRVSQTERLENIIKIFSLRPLMEKEKAIISAENAVDVLILRAVPNHRFGTFEFLGKSHPKRVKIPQSIFSGNTAYPVSSSIFKLIQINDAGAVFLGPHFVPGKNSFEIWNFQKINPLEKIKVAQRFVLEFRFHNIAPRIGMLLNGLFSPSKSPFPLDFFFPILTVFPQFPTNGGGGSKGK